MQASRPCFCLIPRIQDLSMGSLKNSDWLCIGLWWVAFLIVPGCCLWLEKTLQAFHLGILKPWALPDCGISNSMGSPSSANQSCAWQLLSSVSSIGPTHGSFSSLGFVLWLAQRKGSMVEVLWIVFCIVLRYLFCLLVVKMSTWLMDEWFVLDLILKTCSHSSEREVRLGSILITWYISRFSWLARKSRSCFDSIWFGSYCLFCFCFIVDAFYICHQDGKGEDNLLQCNSGQ